MKSSIRDFLGKHAATLITAVLASFYLIAAGVTRSCPICSAVRHMAGLSLVSTAQAAEPPPLLARPAGAASKAPAWEVRDLDGKTVKSTDFAGKVVIVDFWATWCPPCRAEIPGFVELQKEYGEKGLVIVGVSLDQQGPRVVKPFAEKFGMNYPVVMGDEAIVTAFGGVEGLPTTFVIDRQGDIVKRHVGYAPKTDFETAIKPLL